MPKICTRSAMFLTILLLAASGLTVAAEPKVTSGGCVLAPEYAEGLNVDPSTDVGALLEYQHTIAAMLQQEEFKQLDCLADAARSQKEKFSGGAWKLHILYEALNTPALSQHPTEEDWKALLRHLEHWRSARPQSITAAVAQGSAYVNYGWDARGDGVSGTVSESGWKLYEERLATGRRILEEAASSLPTQCPEWYVSMQRIALGQGWPREDAQALLIKAMKLDPTYFYIYRMFAVYVLPQWNGEEGDSEKFAAAAADRVGGEEGDILYFQLTSHLVTSACRCVQVSWPRVDKGFAALEKRYGTSLLNLNLYAFMAVQASQPAPAKEAFTRIGKQWDEHTWHTEESFATSRNWAAQYAPLQAKQHSMESSAQENGQTADGLRYKAAFEKKYKQFAQQCVKSSGGAAEKFETLTSVGVNGTVEEPRIYSNSLVAMCLYQKLMGLKQKNETAFPKPPQTPYWIRLDLDTGQLGAK